MKVLIAYYSFSGSTEKMAQGVAESLRKGNIPIDVEKIIPEKDYGNTLSRYILGSFYAMRGSRIGIKELKYKPENYDFIIICSPTWAGSPVPAVNTYNTIIKDAKPEQRAIVISTSGGKDAGAVDKMAAVLKKKGYKVMSKLNASKPVDEAKIKAAAQEVLRIVSSF